MKLNKTIKYISLIFIVINSLFILNSVILYNINSTTKTILYNNEFDIKNENNIRTSDNDSGWISIWGDTQKLIREYGEEISMDGMGNIYVIGSKIIFEEDSINSSLCLLKYNSSGSLIWERIWIDLEFSAGVNIVVNNTGTSYLVGYTEDSESDDTDICVLSYDPNGILQWDTQWGGSKKDLGSSISIDNSNNIYIGGTTESSAKNGTDILLLKYNSSGHLQWNKTWDNSESDFGGGIAIDMVGDINIVGTTNGTWNENNPLLLKYNSSGDLNSTKIWYEFSIYSANVLLNDSMNNFYIGGNLYSSDKDHMDVFLFKYNSSGEIEWNTTWGGGKDDVLGDFTIDKLGNIYMTGYTNSYGGSTNIFLLNYSSNGILQWYDILGDNSINWAFGIYSDIHDNIYITGLTAWTRENLGNLFLLKYDPEMEFFPSSNGISGFDLSILFGIISLSIVSLFIIKKKAIKYKS